MKQKKLRVSETSKVLADEIIRNLMKMENKEHQLLALLYRVEELLLELRSGGSQSEDYKKLQVIIINLEKHLSDEQDLK